MAMYYRAEVRHRYQEPIANGLSYLKEDILGSGTYATVHLGCLHNVEVAVKKIEKYRSNGDENREVNLQKQLQHENVLKILAVEEGDEFR